MRWERMPVLARYDAEQVRAIAPCGRDTTARNATRSTNPNAAATMLAV